MFIATLAFMLIALIVEIIITLSLIDGWGMTDFAARIIALGLGYVAFIAIIQKLIPLRWPAWIICFYGGISLSLGAGLFCLLLYRNPLIQPLPLLALIAVITFLFFTFSLNRYGPNLKNND